MYLDGRVATLDHGLHDVIGILAPPIFGVADTASLGTRLAGIRHVRRRAAHRNDRRRRSCRPVGNDPDGRGKNRSARATARGAAKSGITAEPSPGVSSDPRASWIWKNLPPFDTSFVDGLQPGTAFLDDIRCVLLTEAVCDHRDDSLVVVVIAMSGSRTGELTQPEQGD